MQRIISVILIIILLVSNITLTFGVHFCSGVEVTSKIMIGHDHLSCGMASIDVTCDGSENQTFCLNNATCCETQYQTLIASVDFFIVEKQQVHFHLDSAVLVLLLINDLLPKTPHFYTEYSPPPLERNIQILFQTFLI
jgi:hypothetical protein